MSNYNTSVFRSVDLDETEEQVSATPVQVFGWNIFNDSAASIFVQFYNATAANVTVGTTTPVLTVGIEAGKSVDMEWTNPIRFDTALSVAATTGPTGAGAPGANECIINLLYR